MINAQVALYPLKTNHATLVIDDAVNSLSNCNVNFKVNSLNTDIAGTTDDVFNSLKQLFNEAVIKGGEISMVVTITNAID